MTDHRSATVEDEQVRIQRYERLIRAYPPRWRAQHGEALLGLLLDSHRDAHPAGRALQALDLTRHGLALRVTTVMPAEVRSTLASTALGVGLAFSLADAAVYGWLRYANWREGIGGTIWFPSAWLLLIAASATRLPAVRVAAWLLAVAVFIGVPVLHLSPLFIVPWSRTLAPMGSHGVLTGHFEVLWQYALPSGAANDAAQVLLATVSLIGTPRRRTTAAAVLASAPILAVAFALIGISPSWNSGIDDDAIWSWPWPFPPGPTPFACPATYAAAALAVVTRAVAPRSPMIAARTGLAALVLLTGVIALIFAGPVWVPF